MLCRRKPILALSLLCSAQGSRQQGSLIEGADLRRGAVAETASVEQLAENASRPVHPRQRRTSPVIWVPGITSDPLQARRTGKPLGNPDCEKIVPRKGWYGLYINPTQALNLGCLMWQMKLQPPDPNDPEHCVRDAEGIEVDPLGYAFGTTAGAEALDPWPMFLSHAVPIKLYAKITKMLASLGLERDTQIRFATHDWRKFGDKCWERLFFSKFQGLIEETSYNNDEAVTLGCHSMGCQIVHVFLNQMTPEWKARHIHEFIAAGPDFAGSTLAVENFIQGPSYDLLPLFASKLARSAMVSWPAFYTLFPTQMGSHDFGYTWDVDEPFVSTYWKNYTIEQLRDGSFFDDVELPDDTASDQTVIDESIDIESTSFAWAGARANLDKAVTENGCICMTRCGTALTGGLHLGVRDNTDSKQDELNTWSRPWCYTHGNCGSTTYGLDFSIFSPPVQERYWDWCGGQAKAIDAGPGFEFFPGVTTMQSFFVERWFGAGEGYARDETLSLEQQKARCLADPVCTGFDTDGYLKQRQDYTPDSSWRGIQQLKDGVMQGLYMKRPAVSKCQRKPCSSGGRRSPICGSDGVTYEDRCAFERAQCWKDHLDKQGSKPCWDLVAHKRTKNDCQCKSPCQPDTGRKRFCYTEHRCGKRSRRRVDQFIDECSPGQDIALEALDTGRGFSYYHGYKVRTNKLGLGKNGTHMDELEEACGIDPECGGVDTDGVFYKTDDKLNTGAVEKVDMPSYGVYEKQQSVLSCQKLCGGEVPQPVCIRSLRKTFRSECVAHNFRCLLRQRTAYEKDPLESSAGPCQRYGGTGLHQVATEVFRRAEGLKAPGVPVNCLHVADTDTSESWTFYDFLEKGMARKTGKGDGSVNLRSLSQPCKYWQSVQAQPVKVTPLEYGGTVSHVSMLKDMRFIEELRKAMRGGDDECNSVNGAYALPQPEPARPEERPRSRCRCALEKASVVCGERAMDGVDGTSFNLNEVVVACQHRLKCRSLLP